MVQEKHEGLDHNIFYPGMMSEEFDLLLECWLSNPRATIAANMMMERIVAKAFLGALSAPSVSSMRVQ